MVSYLPLSHIAAQIYDLWTGLQWGAKVCFAEPDALKVSRPRSEQGSVDMCVRTWGRGSEWVPRTLVRQNSLCHSHTARVTQQQGAEAGTWRKGATCHQGQGVLRARLWCTAPASQAHPLPRSLETDFKQAESTPGPPAPTGTLPNTPHTSRPKSPPVHPAPVTAEGRGQVREEGGLGGDRAALKRQATQTAGTAAQQWQTARNMACARVRGRLCGHPGTLWGRAPDAGVGASWH